MHEDLRSVVAMSRRSLSARRVVGLSLLSLAVGVAPAARAQVQATQLTVPVALGNMAQFRTRVYACNTGATSVSTTTVQLLKMATSGSSSTPLGAVVTTEPLAAGGCLNYRLEDLMAGAGLGSTYTADGGNLALRFTWPGNATTAPVINAVTNVVNIAPSAGATTSPVAGPLEMATFSSKGKTITVTVSGCPPPATPVIQAPSPITVGQATTATVTNHAGSSYAWTISNGTIATGQGTSAITFMATAAGTVTLTVVETNACGSSPRASMTTNAQVPSPFTLTVTRAGAGVVTSNPAGISCGGTCSAPFSTGSVVSLTAQADSGAAFIGWSGEGCSGTGPCTVTMTQARNVTATFSTVCTLSCAASVPSSASPGQPVPFGGSSAGCSGTVYSWTFGDGATSTLASPSHTYPTAGTYAWTFSASAPGATNCTRSGSISVGNLLAITSINPASGPTAGGTAVTILGTGFQPGATVRLGGVTATDFAFVSGTTITAKTPPHGAGAVDVDVANPDGQSARRVKGFSYQESPVTLTIQNITPNYGPRTGGTSVTIKGTAFQSPVGLYFGGTNYPATFVTVVDSTTITAKTPVHAAGNVEVTVSSGGSNAKLTNGFRYTDVATHIDNVDPSVGSSGTPVTITGVGFTPGILVKFNGVTASSVNVQSSTTIRCNVPPGSGRAIPVSVAGSDNNGSFTYAGGGAANASLTAVIPSAGQLNGGSSVTITGSGFQSGASVYFGANQATNVTVVDSTRITATVPALPAARQTLALATGEPQSASVVVVNPDSSAMGGSGAFTYSPPGGGCLTSGVTQCLSGSRFTVQVAWKNPYDGGTIGVGHPIQLTSDTGSFWFFSDQNTELMVKILDGSTVNGYFWVFFGALSDVEYTLTVTDTATGIAKSYYNPPRNLGSVADTRAFFVGNRPVEAEAEAEAGPSISPQLLERTEARLRAEATERAETIAALATTCLPNDLAHCLSGGRFRVSATWRNPYDGGTTGVGHAVQLTADTGYFWFFADSNVELVVKVLDGTSTNGRYWVFYGALSDVEYTITVTDTLSGAVKTYYNPPQHLGSVADTGAF